VKRLNREEGVMKVNLSSIKIGLLLVIFTLIFGICMDIGFGINEEYFKDYIAQGIEMHSALHDQKGQSKIWRYAQRSHFHATGIAAFSLGLLLLMLFSNMKRAMVHFVSVLIGLAIFCGGAFMGCIVTVMTTKSVLSNNTKQLFIGAQRFTF
jgi:FlaA1/EpsC-like NDP-sugar epimerase